MTPKPTQLTLDEQLYVDTYGDQEDGDDSESEDTSEE